MTGLRWLESPLTATVGVLTGLGLLSIPLRHLTSGRAAVPVVHAAETAAAGEVPAVLRLKLLGPASHVTVETTDGKKLLDLADPPAGESEHDAVVPMVAGKAEIVLRAVFGETESAAFLTLMPDGYEDQTRYLTGSGEVAETLDYEWHAH